MLSLELTSIGYGAPKSVKKEQVYGANKLYLSTCFSKHLQWRLHGTDNAVLRLRIPQSTGEIAFCSAWLRGDKDHVLANNQCIPGRATAALMTLQFQVATACGEMICETFGCFVHY